MQFSKEDPYPQFPDQYLPPAPVKIIYSLTPVEFCIVCFDIHFLHLEFKDLRSLYKHDAPCFHLFCRLSLNTTYCPGLFIFIIVF